MALHYATYSTTLLLNQNPGGLTLSQSKLGAANTDDQGIAERCLVGDGDLFTGGESKVDETPAVFFGTVETFDSHPAFAGNAA